MRIKLKIRQKIFLFVLSTTMILYVIAIGYIVTTSRQAMLTDALENARLTARISSDKIEKEFERDLSLTRTLAQAFSIYQEMPPALWQDLFIRMYKPILENNKHVYSIWDSWELYGFVPKYDKDYGRICLTLWRENNEIKKIVDYRSLDGDGEIYKKFKLGNQEGFWDPYLDEGNVENKGGALLMTTVASPIQKNGKYMGLIGLDISLGSLQKMVSEIEPVEGSYAFLVSANSLVAAHKEQKFINVPLGKIFPNEYEKENLAEVISEGREHSFIRVDSLGNEHFISFAPIKAGNSYSSWSLALSIPLKVITERADENLYVSLFVGIIGLLVLMLVLFFVANNLTRPIRRITLSLDRLSKGEISNDLILKLNSGDEIETMAKSLNISIEGLNKKTSFANSIGQGKLESKLDLLGDNDILGKSLLNMSNSLKKAQDEEKLRIIEDNKRTWANEGFALFADILRQNNDNLENLADEVLKKIVKYTKGNQGALFLLNDDDKRETYLEAASIYAGDRKKFLNMKVMMGEGLIGACALERETIFITDIPENFVSITSGLGEANPNCIIIVPLKQDENILGVLEIASFKIFEQYEIEFLEKVSENIASTIAIVKINAKTRMLLEQSQQQAEEMQAQEEEMRQNMEELMATQEEMARKEREIAWTMDAIGGLGLIMEYDFNGAITYVNKLLCDRSGYSKEELIGQHHSILFENRGLIETDDYQVFWDNMHKGIPFESILYRMTKAKEPFAIKGHCRPVFDDHGSPIKVVEIAFDVTEFTSKS
ncbi:MAG: GAF domain-containing protein [Bacteroidales bacterium]|jgi:PAS domain S-box-containing protein|nr:GAF domain-containing protein [Bacteroidales bacterium]MDD4385728.1 GAF domain-containing protein [Bacteroidales bacterium]MDY0196327.1 GAF domain-containing protein [Tenuifilaceae bacterium]